MSHDRRVLQDRAACARVPARPPTEGVPASAGAWSAAELAEFARAGWSEPDALLDAALGAVLRRVPGRETFALRSAGALAVVKRARERRAPWDLLGVRGPSLGRREHANLVLLARDGLPVPRAIGWAERLERGAVRSLVVMEHVAHAETLRARLGRADGPERRAWSARLAALVLALHERGWYHRDLYLQHVVLRAGTEELVLLDVGRARRERRPRARWFVKDLAALLHSTPRAVGARERLAFLACYLDGRGVVGRAARRRWLARVIAKERRMAAHVPRAGEDRPWEDRG